MNIIIFGTGSGMKRFIDEMDFNKANILCFASNKQDEVEIYDRKVISPEEIKYYEYDFIVICSQYYREIEKQLTDLNIKINKILSYYYYKEDMDYYEKKNFLLKNIMKDKGKLLTNKQIIINTKEIKEQYNNNYKKKDDIWSSTDENYCDLVVNKLVNRRSIIKLLHKDDQILDVGCAKGFFTNSFRKNGFTSIGIDYSEIAIDIAKKNFKNCEFKVMDAFNPKFNNEMFGLVFMRGFSGTNTHNLEFVKNLIDKYYKIIRDGGLLILAYSSDFTGKEAINETANWSMQEINKFISIISFELLEIAYLDYEIENKLLMYNSKKYYYLILKKI